MGQTVTLVAFKNKHPQFNKRSSRLARRAVFLSPCAARATGARCSNIERMMIMTSKRKRKRTVDRATNGSQASRQNGPSRFATIPNPQILIHQFLQTMRMRNCSERTIACWQFILVRFMDWCQERGMEYVRQVTVDHLAAYRRSLYYYRNPKTGHRSNSPPSPLPGARSLLVRLASKVPGSRSTRPPRSNFPKRNTASYSGRRPTRSRRC